MDSVYKLVEWIKNSVEEAGANGVVFGLSGGIDSAVVAGISKIAFPDNSLGVIMPCHSNPKDEEDARLVADKLKLKLKKVDLTGSYDTLLKAMGEDFQSQLALTNVKPRLRMTTLYALAQEKNYLVLGPTNKSEFHLGYFTKHADSGVDLLPIVDFVKEEVYEMAEFLNIPKDIIHKKPSAGLSSDQTDEEDLGISYKDIDSYIKYGEGNKDIANKIDKMHKRSEHKRVYAKKYTK